ncbi:MAG: urea ABC transporter permease subunit UrtC, partial [Lentilitoribacter sp.]
MQDAVLTKFLLRHPSVLVFLGMLAVFTIAVTILSEGFGMGIVSTSLVKTLGKTLCLALAAIAMDLVWGYCGILSLGHFAFFGLGGYMIGMWLMYARTELIVLKANVTAALPLTPQELSDAIGVQIFGVVGGS